MSTTTATATAAVAFYKDFHARKASVINLIDTHGLLNAREEALRAVNDLDAACKRIRSTLPAHDRQAYSQELTKLYALLDSKAALEAKKNPTTTATGTRTGPGSGSGSGRFKFSKKSLESAKLEQMTQKRDRKTLDDLRTATTYVPPKSDTNTNEYKVSGLHGKLVTSSEGSHSNLIVTNISNSAVFLTPTQPPGGASPFSTAKVDTISNSILYIAAVTGPIYLSNIKNCVLIVKCHQFRMHESRDTDVFLACASGRPIIEHCAGLRFAQFSFETTATAMVTKEKEKEKDKIVPWQTVDDFNWLDSTTQSINWKRLSAEEDYSRELQPLITGVLAESELPSSSSVSVSVPVSSVPVSLSRSVDVEQAFPCVTLFKRHAYSR